MEKRRGIFFVQKEIKNSDFQNLLNAVPQIKLPGIFFVLILLLKFNTAFSQDTLKTLSLEELMNIEITTVSLNPEKLTETASAVQVLSWEDIQRSGVTRLPEALHLSPNLQVAQVNSHDWAITARGFNGLPSAGGILANKLLVMIDGRSIYTPLLGGVYWDIQNVLLEDVDRIEIISGPGGTIWGGNAVNGVINVLSKSANETQGLFVSGAAGSFLTDHIQGRYGFQVSPTIYCRVYGQRFDQKNTFLQSGLSSEDAWNTTQGGFRLDYYRTKKTTFTLQGDLYWGDANDSIERIITTGQNLMARLKHIFSNKSILTVNSYYDRTWRITPQSIDPFSYTLNTFNLEIQHRFLLGKRQSITWGLQNQFQLDKTIRLFVPLSRPMPLYSAFIQDEFAIIQDKLKLTLGSKLLYNVFTQFEAQPTARIGFTPNVRHTIWASVSRAVRLPSRFDYDITITEKKFDSEKVIAYEFGYRVNPFERLALSFATFYNHYNDLRSLDSSDSPDFPIIIANSQKAESWGFEFSGNFMLARWWRIRGGYTYFDRYIWPTSPDVLPLSEEFESIDPKNQVVIQSILNLPKNFQLDFVGRYVDVLAAGTIVPVTPSYISCDVRLAWAYSDFEISVVGQNLLQNDHSEVGLTKIPRSVYGKFTCRL